MLDISIEDKDYNAVCYKETGKVIKGNINIYNKIFMSDISDIRDMKFFVYSNYDSLDSIEEEKKKIHHIFGLFYDRQILSFGENVRYIFMVDLLDEEIYHQNNQSGNLIGHVKELKRFNINFEYNDYLQKKKSTFLNLLDQIDAQLDGNWAERYALTRFNVRLFSSICKYRGNLITDYDNDFLAFLSEIKKCVKPNNLYREELMTGLDSMHNMCELYNYIKKNRSKFLDKSEKLYKRNDNVKCIYPINMAGRNVSLCLYDDLLFNSAMPFYYQYRNYENATRLLLDVFYKNITETEDNRNSDELKRAKALYKKGEFLEQTEFDTTLYGLYFPLLMNFRHSIELAYKLIYVNENIKKKDLNNEEIHKYTENLNTHELIDLLELIKDYVDSSEFEFLWKLTSFIYYNEGRDASFSRYIIDSSFDLDDFKKIYIYYVDMYNYINEFFPIMDNIISEKELGFEPDNIF